MAARWARAYRRGPRGSGFRRSARPTSRAGGRRRRRAPYRRGSARSRFRAVMLGGFMARKAGEARQFGERHVHAEDARGAPPRSDPGAKVRRAGPRIDELFEGQLRMEVRNHGARGELLALSVTTPAARPFRTRISADARVVRISTPRSAQARAIASVIAPMPPIAWPQAPFRPFDLAEAMMQQHVGRAGRVGARIGSDDAVEAEDRLDRVALEIWSSTSPAERVKISSRSRCPSSPSGRSGLPRARVARKRRGFRRGRAPSRRSAAFRARAPARRPPAARAAPRRRRAARRRGSRTLRPRPWCGRGRPSDSGRRAGAGNWTAAARRCASP